MAEHSHMAQDHTIAPLAFRPDPHIVDPGMRARDAPDAVDLDQLDHNPVRAGRLRADDGVASSGLRIGGGRDLCQEMPCPHRHNLTDTVQPDHYGQTKAIGYLHYFGGMYSNMPCLMYIICML